MDSSQDHLNALVARPAESLAVELKRWIDPKKPEGIAKIAKAAIALRNRNGGYLIIGFDDKTLRPDDGNEPEDVRTTFSVDTVQAIVSKYAFPLFAVEIAFGNAAGKEYPVIIVPEGTTVPVACKADLKVSDDTSLRKDTVYFRTLRANGTPSSAPAKVGDWAEIVEICFENREADIGRFLRRHLGAERGASFLGLLGGVEAAPTLEDKTRVLLQNSEDAKAEVFEKEGVKEQIAGLGAWSVALVVDPPKEAANSTQEFLNTIASANPNYTGWPVWLDSRTFNDKPARPRKKGRLWEVVMNFLGNGSSSHLDYYTFDARGEFYLWRLMQDDTTDKVRPKTALDPALMLYRVTETIMVGLSFAKAMKFEENATLNFLFKWEGLSGRELDPWANRQVYISSGRETQDDEVMGFVSVPITTAPNAIAPYVQQATLNLYAAFEGFEYPLAAIENNVTKLLSRSF